MGVPLHAKQKRKIHAARKSICVDLLYHEIRRDTISNYVKFIFAHMGKLYKTMSVIQRVDYPKLAARGICAVKLHQHFPEHVNLV